MATNFFKSNNNELVQDMFLYWLISFADDEDESNKPLKECAICLLKKFLEIEKINSISSLRVKLQEYLFSVDGKKYFLDIVISLIVDDHKKIIVIEDKTNSSISNPLKEYERRLIEKINEARFGFYSINNFKKEDLKLILLRTNKKDDAKNLEGTNFKLFDYYLLNDFFYSFRKIDNDLFKDFIISKFGLNFEIISNDEWNTREYNSFLIDLKCKNDIWKKFEFQFDGATDKEIIFKYNTLQAILLFESKKCKAYKWKIIVGKEKLKKDDLLLFIKYSKSGADYWDKGNNRKKLNSYNEIIEMIKEYLENIHTHIEKS